MKVLSLAAIACLSLVILLVPAVCRAEGDRMPERFMLRAGGYEITNANTLVRLDANNLPVGTYLDFQDTLGGETSSTAFRLDGAFRFNDQHSLALAWYDLRFSGARVLGHDITWNGQTYPVSTYVASELKFDVYKLNYQYSLFHNEQAELGASFGFHVLKTSVSLVATDIKQAASESVTAPMPVWGLSASYNFTPRFSAYYSYQFFFINYEDRIKGGLQDFLLGLEYRLFRPLAIGVAYNRFALHVKSVKDQSTLYLDTNWNGGMAYASLYF